MYPLASLHVRDLLGTTLEFFSLRSPTTSDTFLLHESDLPRVRKLPEIPENAVENLYGEVASDASSGGCPETADEAPDSYVDTDQAWDSELDSLSSPHREIARLRSELRLLREKNSSLQHSLYETQQQVRQKDAQVDVLRERNRKLEADYQEMRRLAEERRVEVRSLETFLSKTDKSAGSDLVQTVKDMNSEILRFSAAASESAAGERRTTHCTQGRRKALERVAARFGTKMRHSIEKRDHSQDPTILQYAMQACICQALTHALSSFFFGSSGKLEYHLSRIHRHMHNTEPQPTSSRWRALTHTHMRSMTPNIDELAVNEVTDASIRGIANILTAAGYGEMDDQVQKAQSKYKSQIRRIADSAYKFALLIREGTISTDFHAVYVDSAREFRASTMENLYEGYGPSQGHVLCTTAIGLQSSANRGRDGKDFNEHTVEKRLVLKPKVVLESVIDLLDR